MPGGKTSGPLIKDPKMYEGLWRHGFSKERETAISNA